MFVNDDNQATSIDPEGFEAFFKAHPNDATVEEVPTVTPEETPTEKPATDPAITDVPAEDGAQTAEPKDEQQEAHNPQQAAAFAQMRIANKQQQQLLSQIAQVVGVPDTKDQDTVMSALQSLVIKAQSQKQGIPEDVLERLHTLENTNQEFQRQQAYLAAGQGFQTIKDKFELDDDGLEAFAQELIADGLNPYEQPVDLVREYRDRHFDELIEAAIQNGIAQEAQRSAKAGTHGSTPQQTKGISDEGESKKINSIADLNKWLDENK